MKQWMSNEILDKLSFTSDLGKSLKQISLRNTDLELILQDISRWRSHQMDIMINENLIGMRFKSDDSIMRKYEKTINSNGGFKQCFNDVLGFRVKMEEYPNTFPEYLRVVDLRSGKNIDDGYRAIHLYYQRDGFSYPIEIQLWCGNDYLFNVWSHKHTYKYKDVNIGKCLREKYNDGKITSEEQFLQQLKEMENNDGR